jgi:hypothetical protein
MIKLKNSGILFADGGREGLETVEKDIGSPCKTST